ncbi:sigma-70 family RNA polymerase sigma factor [Dactylosporangium matsuzakiense]|uniref:RNA polymerase sigma factor n=1 Tax=Dactylosporangium matsuzakiense TaxID=53360 RepID=A0A9W6KFS1_9ACTN|nr:sigma-70 family RNA polymerase sigma factor [Dactylosporangium matsuzakiense]UWZ42228.1 sigma-70 family RNA polymerase sigma factor [Dactylosporangium matsuzakiense]GLK99879.1 RNA polymerase sigma factor [Dactylosporangium matsuzakiense]
MLVEKHLPQADAIAARYRYDVRHQDIRQAAALGLVEAAARFDASRGVPFSAYAATTVAGTLKHYIRDNRWMLRAPRRASELLVTMAASQEDLRHRLHREPTNGETAAAIGCTSAEVADAARLAFEQQALSIDAPADDTRSGGATLADLLSDGSDPATAIVDHESLLAELRTLPERELQVVTMRFYGNLAQREIGERIGCSQMHVSRLLARALRRLRTALSGPARCEPPEPTNQPRA